MITSMISMQSWFISTTYSENVCVPKALPCRAQNSKKKVPLAVFAKTAYLRR